VPKPSQTEKLLDCAAADPAPTLFRTPDDRTYAHVDGRTLNVLGKGFRAWLTDRYAQTGGRTPHLSNVREAVETLHLRNAAMPVAEAHVRVAPDRAASPPAIWIDLGSEDWTAVRVDAYGWRIEPHPPAGPYLVRPRTTSPMPTPSEGGELADLRRFLNVSTDDDFRLIVAWLVMALRPTGPYPILSFVGGQGSAKSTTVKVLGKLVDPTVPDVMKLARDDRDLWVSTSKRHVMVFDNVSWIEDWQSDELCRIATGGGTARRTLYTDEEETVLSACRPIMLNGIVNAVTRGDLADRSIMIECPPITDYVPETQFRAEFEAARPALLGALLDALSAALRAWSRADLPRRSVRMADFAKWGTAVEIGLGWPGGSFLEAYESNRQAMRSSVIEADVVAQAMVTKFSSEATPPFDGPISGLARELEDAVPPEDRGRRWPKSPQEWSSRVRRSQTVLAQEGIEVTWDTDSRNRTTYTVARMHGTQEAPVA
jgi:hypothetical protein